MFFTPSINVQKYSKDCTPKKNIIKALRDIGVKVVYATHLHELSEAVDEINAESDNKNRIVGLTAGVLEELSEGEIQYTRTYTIREGMSDGRSYAGDIAKQYGLTYKQMKEQFMV